MNRSKCKPKFKPLTRRSICQEEHMWLVTAERLNGNEISDIAGWTILQVQ